MQQAKEITRMAYSASQSAADASPLPTEDRDYNAVERSSKTGTEIALRFYLRDRIRLSLRYAMITDTVLYGDDYAVLFSASTIFELSGKRLETVLDLIDDERACKLHEFDPRKHDVPISPDEPLIRSIVTLRLRGAEVLDKLPNSTRLNSSLELPALA